MLIKKTSIITTSTIANHVMLIRGQKVIIDSDLAKLYGVTTKRLNEQVKRNLERFPADFMFQLTTDEKKKVVAVCDHLANLKYSKTNPYAFTEHGAIMAASVLNTAHAVDVSVLVVRTFVQLRQMMSTHKELRLKLNQLEHRLDKNDEVLQTLVGAIRQLMDPPFPKKKNPIGFAPWPNENPENSENI